ncbi:MAG: hypothetical protein KAV00_02910, partial [Phycisphaerae bacterium]|nr:hypothetical protein [Phycisphaerae bacterium]
MVGTSKFIFASGNKIANIVVESGEAMDWQSAKILAERVEQIGGSAPPVLDSPRRAAASVVYLGVLDQSPAIRSILNQERILITDTDQADFNADEKIWKPSL